MRKVLQRTGLALGLLAIPALASAQKALVYCPIAQDRTGCDAIVAALTGPAYPGGVDRGHDGTGGTVDLRTVDLSTYTVFLVPSLADDPGSQPYAFLRDSTVAAHLKAGLIGGLAVWSGMPDQGSSNRAQKDQLIRNLAVWAGASQAAAEGPGLVAFLDLSEDEGARYDWLRTITPFRVTSDINLISYDSVRALTPTATAILGAAPGQNNYAGMAVFGLATMNPTPGISLDAVGSTGSSQGGHVVLVTLAAGNTGGPSITTDKADYAPGDTVTFSGTGWGVGEIVTIVLHEDPQVHSDQTITTVADGFGNFTNRTFAIEQQHLLVRFVATATGGTSGSRAQTTFTDGNLQSINLSAPTSVSVAAGNNAGYTVNVVMGGNTNNCTVTLSVTTALPAGAVAAFAAPNPTTTSNLNFSRALTINTTLATPTGTYPFTVQATRGANCQGSGNPTTTGTLVVTAGANVAPVLDPIGNQPVDEGTLLSFTATATDANPGQTRTFSLDAGAPVGAAITPAGVFSWTPTEAQGPGVYPVTIRVTDNGSPALDDSETIQISVAEVNIAPVLNGVPASATIPELSPYSFTATASDGDTPVQPLTFSLSGTVPTGAAIDATTGVFTWTPGESQGPGVHSFDVCVSDGVTTITTTITLTVTEVNQAPVLAAIGNQNADEGVLLSFTATASDGDLPANTLTFSLDAGAPAGAAITAGGAFTFTPTEAQGPGVYPVTIRVTDNGSPAFDDSETIQITVAEVNAAPVLAGVPASATIPELSPYTFTATATDGDSPSQTLTFSLSGTAPSGAAIDGTSGVFTWTPTEAQGGAGPYTFDVIVGDGVTTTSFSTTLTVTEVNQAPVLAAIGNQSVDEGVLLGLTATASDGDLPANTLTFSLDAGAPAGAAITAGGAFTFTPTEAQGPGVYPVTIRVTDNGTPGLDDFETINITVNEVNVAPVLTGVPASATIPELAPYSFDADATDDDVPVQTLTFSLSGAPAGAAIDPGTGAFTWTPTEGQGPGIYTFSVVVGDGVTTTPSSITLTVQEVNQAPVLGAIGNKAVNELVELTFNAAATDADLPANSLTYSLVSSPAGASIHPTTGAFSWTPSELEDGIHSVTVRVSDGSDTDEETISVTVSEVNLAPTLTAIGNKNTDELATLSFTIAGTDPDVVAGVPNTLTFSAPTLPSGAVFTPGTQGFSWTPAENQDGNHSASFQVSDGSLTDGETIQITVAEVNVAPTLTAIGPKSVDELATLSFTAAATDPDIVAGSPQTLTFSLTGSPPSGAAISGAGAFSWTPSETQDGVHPVTVQVTDGAANDDEIVSITVNEVNVAPTLTAIGNQTTDELVNLSFTIAATDPDVVAGVPNTLTFSAPTLPSGASFTAGTQGFSWTPTELQDGIHSASFQVSDGALTDGETIQITVAEVNVAPTLDPIGAQTVNEHALLTFTATGSDPDVIAGVPQPVSFSLPGSPPAGAAISAGGAFSWTPAENQDGPHTVQVQISDGTLADGQGVSITVNEVNVAPTLTVIGNQTTDELVNLSFTIAATDPDLVLGVPNTLTFSAPTLPSGAVFTAGTQGFSWTPSELQDGIHSAAFEVSDGALTDGETIQITVAEVNVAPTLDAIGPKSVNELVLLSFTATGSDPDVIAGVPQPVSFSLTGSPPSGAAIAAGGAFTWTPSELQDGVHPVTVQISDGALSDNEIVSITVNEINLAPALDAIGNQAVNELVQLSFNASATDDDFVAGVPNTKTFTLDPGAPAGAAITTAGVFTWTPTEAQGPGTFPVTVRVTDNGAPALNDFETFNIVVAEVNLPPVLTVPATQTLNWGNVLSVSASANDPDVPANTLTFSLTGAPAGVTINGSTGAIAWTPTPGQIGANTVTVRVTDNGTPALYDEESFTVNVDKRPTTLVYGGATTGQYSDPITASATLTDNGGGTLQGTAIAGKSVSFTLGSQSVSPTPSTNGGGVASGSITLNQSPVPSYTINSAFVTDAAHIGSTDSDGFDITPEDARETYTGPLLVASGSVSDPLAYNIPLQATIRDISAVTGDPATDANAGNITNAKVTFVVRDESNAVVPTPGCSNLAVTLIGADPKVGTAGCTVASLTSAGASMDYNVEVIVNHYYTDGPSVYDENTITVIQLAPGSISGGGYTIHQQSAGTYKGALGLKTNYGFTTKFNKSGKGIQGKVNIVVRGENGKKYHIKSTSVDNMALLPDGHAEFYSKANITDITNPLAPVLLGGGYSLAITLWDKGEPGSADIIGITLKNGNTLLYSSQWDGVKTVEKLIDGGNLQVRQK